MLLADGGFGILGMSILSFSVFKLADASSMAMAVGRLMLLLIESPWCGRQQLLTRLHHPFHRHEDVWPYCASINIVGARYNIDIPKQHVLARTKPQMEIRKSDKYD